MSKDRSDVHRAGATTRALALLFVLTLCLVALGLSATAVSANEKALNVTVNGVFSNQTMYNTTYYSSSSSSQWLQREVTFHCTGGRSNNENRLWCYSDGYLKKSNVWLSVNGGQTYRWDFTNFTTLKGLTKWTCTFKADLNNEPDKSATKSVTF
jgi:hypothetical protein